MNEKELRECKEILRKQREEVSSSKSAARNLLTQLGLLTPSGKLKKAYRNYGCNQPVTEKTVGG